jgi:hypothetical protein
MTFREWWDKAVATSSLYGQSGYTIAKLAYDAGWDARDAIEDREAQDTEAREARHRYPHPGHDGPVAAYDRYFGAQDPVFELPPDDTAGTGPESP